MKKRALSLILAAVMVCALLPTVALADTATPSGSHYADVPTDAWYAEAVNAMTEGGLFTGYSDGLFHPDDPVTFAQMAVVLCRVMGLETANPADAPEGTHWAQTAWDNVEYERPSLIKCRYDTGVEYYYTIDDNACRGKVLESLVNLASHISIYNSRRHEPQTETIYIRPSKLEASILVRFEQISPKIWTKQDIPDWKREWNADEKTIDGRSSGKNIDGINGDCILLAYNIGITNGIDKNGTCNALGDVTRAQLCQFLWNMDITTKGSVTRNLRQRPFSIHRYVHPESYTNLQYYTVFPTYKDAHIDKFTCDYIMFGNAHSCYASLNECDVCSGRAVVTDEDNRNYELEKQAAYDEHDQWLKEFQGTRQWEIATGKV